MSARIVENNGRAKTSTGFEWIFLCFFFLLLPFVDLFIPLIQKLTRVTIDIMRCIFEKRIESRFDDFSSSSSRAWKDCVKINWSRWKKKKKSSSFRKNDFSTRLTWRIILKFVYYLLQEKLFDLFSFNNNCLPFVCSLCPPIGPRCFRRCSASPTAPNQFWRTWMSSIQLAKCTSTP